MLYDLVYKTFPAILMIAWNSWFFWIIGRWSIKRKPRYKIGDAIVKDIMAVLDRRQLIGDNTGGINIVHSRRWLAFGNVWEIRVVQETANGDRTRSSTEGGTLPQG